MFVIEWDIVLFFAIGVALLYGLGWLLLVPLKRLLWFLLNSVAGVVVLLVLKAVGMPFGLQAVATPFAAVITGFLGVPGLGLVLLLQNLL